MPFEESGGPHVLECLKLERHTEVFVYFSNFSNCVFFLPIKGIGTENRGGKSGGHRDEQEIGGQVRTEKEREKQISRK